MIDLHALSTLCPSLVFNNPGKIMDACFIHEDYGDAFLNPCTAAIGGLFFGALLDGTSGAATTGGMDYYDGGTGIETTAPTAPTTSPEGSLSDFLPSDYKADSPPSLSDVID